VFGKMRDLLHFAVVPCGLVIAKDCNWHVDINSEFFEKLNREHHFSRGFTFF
jgi:hypothetical protein